MESKSPENDVQDLLKPGRNVSHPTKFFDVSKSNSLFFSFHQQTSTFFCRHNYEKPTPIQAQALPIILSGRNMIGIAKTGSGKTLAFVLPMFRHIKDQPPLEGDDGPIGKKILRKTLLILYHLALIMAPTRELALQTTKECNKFAKLFNLRCVAVYGGTGISEQIVS